MVWHTIIYLCGLAAVAIFAGWKGGAPERTASIIAIIATAVSAWVLMQHYPRFALNSAALLAIDIAAFLAFTVLALTAARFWPVIVAGIQGATVVVHLCRLLQPDILPWGYSVGVQVASDLNNVVMLLGIYCHWHRVKAEGQQRSWVVQTRSNASL